MNYLDDNTGFATACHEMCEGGCSWSNTADSCWYCNWTATWDRGCVCPTNTTWSSLSKECLPNYEANVGTCSPGWTWDKGNGTCIACHWTCSHCDSSDVNTCTSCDPRSYRT